MCLHVRVAWYAWPPGLATNDLTQNMWVMCRIILKPIGVYCIFIIYYISLTPPPPKKKVGFMVGLFHDFA